MLIVKNTVVVTGAAGGIGAAAVRQFLDAGYEVVGLDRNVSVRTLFDFPSYRGLVVDVTDAGALQDLSLGIGPVSHLVVVAGGALAEEVAADFVEPGVWQASIDANLSSAYNTVYAFREELMAAAGDRSVTLTSSINAIQGFGLIPYSAAKAGLTGMMHGMLRPLGALGIRVNCVLPGTTPTPRTIEEWRGVPDHFDRMAAQVPLGKLGTVDDVATVIRCVALEMSHVHGSEIVVDGGQSKSR